MNRQEANKQILDMYNDSAYQELKAYYDKTDGSFQQLIEHVRQNFPYIQIEEY